MNQNELYHVGIKGMRWGHRKQQSQTTSTLAKIGKHLEKSNAIQNEKILAKQEQKGPINKKYSKEDRLADQQIYGTTGVRQISKRMDKGQSHAKASMIQIGKDTTKHAAISLLTLDVISGGAIHKAGINAVSKIMKSEMARKSVVKIAQNHKFDPTDAIFREIIG